MIPIGPYYKPSVTFQIIFWSRFFDFIEAEQKINQIFIFLHNFNALLNSVYYLLSFKLPLFCSHAIQFKFAPISKSCQLFFLFSLLFFYLSSIFIWSFWTATAIMRSVPNNSARCTTRSNTFQQENRFPLHLDEQSTFFKKQIGRSVKMRFS